MRSPSTVHRLRGAVIAAGAVLGLTLLAPAGRWDGPPAGAQILPEGVEIVQLVAGCQIRAFMPHYRAGTPLFEISDDFVSGNPRFWFMQPAPVPLPTGLYDKLSPERSVVEVLTEEAGFVCVDFATAWHRPYQPPPPCRDEPVACLGPEYGGPAPGPTYAPP